MVSTFGGINIAHSALSASRLGLQISGQNIANMDDPNYSKQVVRTDSRFLNSSGIFSGQHATFDGVGVTQLSRVTDQFLVSRHNAEISSEGQKKEKVDLLSGIERAYNEPGETSLQNTLAEFWDSWEQLANTPEENSAKTAVVRRGQAVADSIKYTASNLDTLREHDFKRLGAATEQANALIRGIAELNQQISANSLNKTYPPNELMDKREALVRDLSEYGKVTVSYSKTNEMFVHLSGTGVVGGGGSYAQLKTQKVDGPGGATDPNFTAEVQVIFGKGTPHKIATLPEGKIKAIAENINEEIPNQQKQLDEVAIDLWKQVNKLHLEGRSSSEDNTSREFFAYPNTKITYNSANGKWENQDGSTATDDDFKNHFAGISRKLSVNTDLTDDPKLIATRSVTGGTVEGKLGNGTAIQIADIANQPDSPEAKYRNNLTDLGVKTRAAKTSLDQQKAQTKRANEERLSVSGVNADEETINMSAMLKSYQAAARYMSTLDSMLDTLINGTGLVGR